MLSCCACTCSTYRDRLRREHGAQLLRVRWYGHRDASARTQRLWVERKTHRERWTGETSVKVHEGRHLSCRVCVTVMRL